MTLHHNTASDSEQLEHGIDRTTLRRLADAWPRRATIRNDLDRIESAAIGDPAIPDYPLALLPFAGHADYVAASPEQRQRILTLAWLTYNERVIAAEEYIANPAFVLIMHDVFPGADRIEVKQTVQQAHIDETWHTYMHMLALQRTREFRAVVDEPVRPPAVTFRRYREAIDNTSEPWERDLLTLTWATVAEVSVNAYLTLLSRDTSIQPLHALVPRLHARDESAHSSMMVEVAKALYIHMNTEQKAAFCRAIPRALHAFAEQDYGAWHSILSHCGLTNAAEIVNDSAHSSASNLLVRDFSGVRRVIDELEIADRVHFDFGPATAQSTA